jgi:hypothetical protein
MIKGPSAVTASVCSTALVWFSVLSAVAEPPPPGGTEGHGGEGGFGVTVTTADDGGYVDSPGSPSTTVVRTTVSDCGPSGTGHTQLPVGNNVCAIVWLQCEAAPSVEPPKPTITDQLIQTTYADGHIDQDVACRVASTNQRPQVTPEMARAQAEKLLPHPEIGTAPTGGATLVNIETVLWVKTDGDLTLGTVTLLGHRVTLRAHLERVHWNFGDESTDTVAGPGPPYTHGNPCRTADCPNYFGHTYRRTGPVAIEAELTWTGQFQVDGGAWQDIPGIVTAPATSQPMRVKEARGVLVDNP